MVLQCQWPPGSAINRLHGDDLCTNLHVSIAQQKKNKLLWTISNILWGRCIITTSRTNNRYISFVRVTVE